MYYSWRMNTFWKCFCLIVLYAMLKLFPLHAQGCAWIHHALQHHSANIFLTQPNCAALFPTQFPPYFCPSLFPPRLSLQLHSCNCSSSAKHPRLSHSRELKHFGDSVASPNWWQREKTLHSLLPVCYMLTDNQLGNHRENRAVLGRGG